ncbi:uncharacterized protein LOC108864062 [Galendromus occidentalis]|uniref:Uncharacterized protein LOC108864062 n=1 Tax=Galendromus occidentalis TaxID=34638 RepID=A0AAJ7P9F4_9ACAR|nr:uncharacterized protein LOC108864062 [Galendromus occidentalis]
MEAPSNFEASQIMQTERGKLKLAFRGRMYTQDKRNSIGILQFWRCEFKDKCRARLHTAVGTDEVVKVVGEHSDPADAAYVEVAAGNSELKRRALSTQEAPSQLLNNLAASLTVAGRGCLPKHDSIKRRINRMRGENSQAPACPTDRASIIIVPEAYTMYQCEPGASERFLLGDSGVGDEKRSPIFGRESAAEWVADAQRIHVDGTFSLAPGQFEQLFVILADRGGYAIPLCYGLLPDKSEESYRQMLDLIMEAFPALNISSIAMDFEMGLINAFKAVFPTAEVHGCLFHLVKNMKKKVASFNLAPFVERTSECLKSGHLCSV